MDPFNRANLKELADALREPALSVYMPTIRAGREVRQNAIRFKNLLKRAFVRLSERGMADAEIRQLFAGAAGLEANDDWWQHQSDGLAMFVAADRFDLYRLPLEFEERLTVGKRFHVRPLVRLLESDGHFYVLAVSQNRVRLLEGTRSSVSEIEPEGLPSDLRTALNIDQYVSSLQQHTTGAAGVAGTMLFHGHGASDADVRKKDEILPFFRRINTALSDYFDNDREPLVFAGVEYLFPIFRQACDHKGLVESAVRGNPDDLSPEAIHQQAWTIVEPVFRQCRESAWEQFEHAAGSRLASDQLDHIVRAAAVGQIDTLIVADGAEAWGVVDERSGAVAPAPPHAEDVEDLVNYAVVHALTHGGAVYSMPANRFVADKPALATLRYPLALQV